MHLQHRQCGFTLLELMIGVVIMSLIMYVTVQSLRTGTQVSARTLDNSLMAADAGRILHDIAIDLRSADKDYAYKTLGGQSIRFAFSTCTGFTDKGAPKWDVEGKQMLEFDADAGTLTKYFLQSTFDDTTVGSDAMEGALLASNVVNFDVTPVDSLNIGTVYGNRFLLELSLISNQGRVDEMITSASRVVFLRSFLFNRDGLGANDGSGGSDFLNPNEDDAALVMHPSKDLTPESLPPNSVIGTESPELLWGKDTSSETQTWHNPITDTDHTVDMILIRLTLRGVAVQFGTPLKDGNLKISGQSISCSLPYHEESEFRISVKMPSGGKEVLVDQSTEVLSEVFYVDIYGPKIGSMPVTVTAKSPSQILEGTSFTGGSFVITRSY